MGILSYYFSVRPERLGRALQVCESDDDLWKYVNEWEQQAKGGPEGDYYSGSKQWDGLWWMVDPARQRGEGAPSNALGKAVVGANRLFPNPGTSHLIYWSWRLVSQEEVGEAAAAFSSSSVRDRFDPVAALTADVYFQFFQLRPEDYEHYFDHLTRFYNLAASRGRAVLVVLD